MFMPAVHGVIDRRILVNYRVDAEVMRALLPTPFEPVLVDGFAMAGICLIRLRAIRPKGVPVLPGLCSENAAHRVAVQWSDVHAGAGKQVGVYIPRRDTSSWLNSLVGGRLFPGVHHRARFDVAETASQVELNMTSDDGTTAISVAGCTTDAWPADSVFASVEGASAFYEAGCVGYSDASSAGRFDGLELRCVDWSVKPLAAQRVASSWFDDPARFPPGTAVFDHALLMREVEHSWHSLPALRSTPQTA